MGFIRARGDNNLSQRQYDKVNFSELDLPVEDEISPRVIGAYYDQLRRLELFNLKLRESASAGPTPEQKMQGLSMILDMIPGVGDVKSGVDAWRGKDTVTEEDLPGWARVVAALGALPLIPSLVYAGKMAKGAKVGKAVEKSEALEGVGKWFRGSEGKMRFEIDDRGAELNFNVNQIALGSKPRTVGQFVNHPELFKAYPELKDMPIKFNTGSGSNYGDGIIDVGLASKDLKKAVIHELQHAVQEIEGFAKGGNPGNELNEIRKIANKRMKDIGAKMNDIKWKIGASSGKEKENLLKELDKLYKEQSDAWEMGQKAQAAFESYRNLPGEVESREVAERAVRKR